MTTAIVTGGAGFIGSHVVDALLAEGRRVVVIDDLSAGRVANVNEAAELVQVDITDGEALAAAIDAARPAAIFHLAAQASVTASVDDPLRDCRVNVEGTLNVLESARRHGASVVFTSTGGALYGDEAPLPTPESYAARPLSPYGASKLAAEAYVRAWSDAHGTPNAVCRLGNVYGPRQEPARRGRRRRDLLAQAVERRGTRRLRPRQPDARLRPRPRRRQRADRRLRPRRHVQRRHRRGDRRREPARAPRDSIRPQRARRAARPAGRRAAPLLPRLDRAPRHDGLGAVGGDRRRPRDDVRVARRGLRRRRLR